VAIVKLLIHTTDGKENLLLKETAKTSQIETLMKKFMDLSEMTRI